MLTTILDLKPVANKNKRQRFLERHSHVVTFYKKLGNNLKTGNIELNGNEYVIPKGFVFDGASIFKFLRTFFSH